jgi:hypothetical protein
MAIWQEASISTAMLTMLPRSRGSSNFGASRPNAAVLAQPRTSDRRLNGSHADE